MAETPAPGPASPQPRLLDRRHRTVTVGVVAVMTLVAFEGVGVATAMPVAARALDGLAVYAWAFNAYVAASLVGMVLSGTWCDRSGPRMSVAAGTVAFGGGAGLAGLAPTMAWMVAGRAVQGVGGGVLIVGVYVLIARAFDECLRPRAFSLLAAAWVLPAVVGPFVAGWLADSVTWRAVFLLVPAFVLPPAVLLLPVLGRYDGGDGAPGRPGRIPAALVAAAGLVAVQDGLQRLGAAGLAEGVAGLAAVLPALRRLLPAGTLRFARGLPTTVAMRGVLAGAFFAAETFVPLALTSLRGVSTTASGLVLTAAAFGWVAGSWWQGRLPGDADRARTVTLGAALACAGVGTLPLSLVPGLPPYVATLSWLVGSAGMGMAFPSIAVQTMRLSPDADQGVNSSALQLGDSASSVLMVGTAGAVHSAAVASGGAGTGTYVAIWLGAAAVLVAGVALAPRMRPAAPAHPPRAT